jgi:O-antigen ligase
MVNRRLRGLDGALMRSRSWSAGWRTRQSTLKLAGPVAPVGEAYVPAGVSPSISRSSLGVMVSNYPPVAPAIAVLLLALIAARLSEIIPGSSAIHPSLVSAIIGGGYVLSRAPQAARIAAGRNPIVRAFAMYGGWALLMSPFALWPGHAIKSLYPMFVPGLLLILVLSLCLPTLRVLDWILGGLVLAYGALFLSVASDNVVFQGRLYAGSLDPNDLASCAAIIFPPAVMIFVRRPRLSTLPMLGVALISLYIVGQTASRGGVLALAAGILTLVLLLRWKARSLAILALIILVPLAWGSATPTFRARVNSLTALDQDYNATEYDGRKAVWKRGVGYATKHPITGVGLNNFEVAEGQSLAAMGLRGKWSTAHNAYVQAFAELGFVGGFVLVLLLWRAGRAFAYLARRPNRADDRPEFLAALVGWAVGAYFLSQAYFWGFFGLLALAALATSIKANEAVAQALGVQAFGPGSGQNASSSGTRGRQRGVPARLRPA